jgi:hypothetical protein
VRARRELEEIRRVGARELLGVVLAGGLRHVAQRLEREGVLRADGQRDEAA